MKKVDKFTLLTNPMMATNRQLTSFCVINARHLGHSNPFTIALKDYSVEAPTVFVYALILDKEKYNALI